MKIPTSRRNHGFTLVELLVVIAIIAVLAGAGFAAGNAAVQKAKKTTAQATCTSLELAVSNFFTEYGTIPAPTAITNDTVYKTDASGVAFLNILLGLETGSSIQNSRSIKFLSVKEGKGNKSGLIYNPAGTAVSGLFDPWGGPYHVMVDGDYDERVSPSPTNGTTVNLNGRRAAAWSEGADYDSGKKIADDVKTW